MARTKRPKQLALFPTDRREHTDRRKPLVCAFGTPWLDHFDPPVGTGKGCPRCWDETWNTPTGREQRETDRFDQSA
jgi:hypothetical protein